jgi:hypothetical protein
MDEPSGAAVSEIAGTRRIGRSPDALRGSSYEYSNRFSTAKTAAAARVETPILS